VALIDSREKAMIVDYWLVEASPGEERPQLNMRGATWVVEVWPNDLGRQHGDDKDFPRRVRGRSVCLPGISGLIYWLAAAGALELYSRSMLSLA